MNNAFNDYNFFFNCARVIKGLQLYVTSHLEWPIKDHEHKRRSNKQSANMTIDLNTTVMVNQEMFLKNEKNKTQLILLLSSQLRREGHDIRNSDGDADTLIVSAAVHYAAKGREVVVVASDTDILVLLMFHWKPGMELFMYATAGKGNNGKKEWKVENVVWAAGERNCEKHHLYPCMDRL